MVAAVQPGEPRAHGGRSWADLRPLATARGLRVGKLSLSTTNGADNVSAQSFVAGRSSLVGKARFAPAWWAL